MWWAIGGVAIGFILGVITVMLMIARQIVVAHAQFFKRPIPKWWKF